MSNEFWVTPDRSPKPSVTEQGLLGTRHLSLSTGGYVRIAQDSALNALARLLEGLLAHSEKAELFRSDLSRAHRTATGLLFQLLARFVAEESGQEPSPWRKAIADAAQGRTSLTRAKAFSLLQLTPFADHLLPGGDPDRLFDETSGISPVHLLLALDALSRTDSVLGGQDWADFREVTPHDLGQLYESLQAFQPALAASPGDQTSLPIEWRKDDQKKKASGSFYTPDQIVRHIVESAVGPLWESAFGALKETSFSPGASLPPGFRLRVLDPAMGCGYFLLAASDDLYGRITEGDGWKRSTPEERRRLRKEIASRCLYGVDKDPVAVYLSRLALTGWIHGSVVSEPEPGIARNLKCGDSLVGARPGSLHSLKRANSSEDVRRFVDRQTAKYFIEEKSNDLEEGLAVARNEPTASTLGRLPGFRKTESAENRRAQQAAGEHRFFHWELEFPEVFSADSPAVGFDAVIGNPPYDNSRGGLFKNPELAAVARFARESGLFEIKGAVDLYRLFLQRSLELCRPGGTLSMIVPRSLLGDRDAIPERRLLLKRANILQVDDFPYDDGPRRVFPAAGLATCILTARKGEPSSNFTVRRWSDGRMSRPFRETTVFRETLEHLWPGLFPFFGLNDAEHAVLQQLLRRPWLCPLSEIAEGRIGEANSGYHKAFMSDCDTGTLLVRGIDVMPYFVQTDGVQKRWIEREEFLASLASGARAGLRHAHVRVVKQAVRNLSAKKRIVAALAEPDWFLADSTDFFLPNPPYDPRYILALLNSDTVPEWLFQRVSTNNNVNLYQLRHLPVPRIRFGDLRENGAAQVSEGWEITLSLRERAVSFGLEAADDAPVFASPAAGGIPWAKNVRASEEYLQWKGWLLGLMRESQDVLPEALHTLVVRLSQEMIDLTRLIKAREEKLEDSGPLCGLREATRWLLDELIWRMYGLSEEESDMIRKSGD